MKRKENKAVSAITAQLFKEIRNKEEFNKIRSEFIKPVDCSYCYGQDIRKLYDPYQSTGENTRDHTG